MQKISLELPKFRLELHAKLVKRRKPLMSEPILPTKAVVNKKYRTGTLVGRFVRYLADHKSIRKVFATGFVFTAVLVGFSPQNSNIQVQADETVIMPQTTFITQKGMQYPVASVTVNQGYGFFHPGVDLGGPVGTPIKPIMPGVVAYAGWDYSGYGNLVVLSHKNGFDSYYAHLSKIEVATGNIVDMNTEIGKMGVTGHSTGSHLHLEIHQNGVSLNPLTVLSR
jgi:murein DD-endopeptidase MepM/ murein hydrolase activator NlpD